MKLTYQIVAQWERGHDHMGRIYSVLRVHNYLVFIEPTPTDGLWRVLVFHNSYIAKDALKSSPLGLVGVEAFAEDMIRDHIEWGR